MPQTNSAKQLTGAWGADHERVVCRSLKTCPHCYCLVVSLLGSILLSQMNAIRLSSLTSSFGLHRAASSSSFWRRSLGHSVTGHSYKGPRSKAIRQLWHASTLRQVTGSASDTAYCLRPVASFYSTRAGSASSTSSVLQFISSRISQATHRSGLKGFSRIRGSGHHYQPPKGPFRRVIDSLPSGVIIWGILGINGLIFASWFVATANVVSSPPVPYDVYLS